MLWFSAAAASHTGLVRSINEDSVVITPELLLVADGVGGGPAGEVASAVAAATVLEHSRRAQTRFPVLILADAVRRAQERVAQEVSAQPARQGMATTLTVVMTNGTDSAMAHLGDSRAYAQRDGELLQLTRDHTWTAQAVDRGLLTTAEADAHPWRNVILRSVNGAAGQAGDVLPLALRVGDRLLLASDGLTDLVPAGRIERLFTEPDDRRLCEALIAAALAQGGRDNVSVVVATVLHREAAEAGRPITLGALAGSS